MVETEVLQIAFPRELLDTIVWYCMKFDKTVNDYVIESVRASIDSEICSNCEILGNYLTDELKKRLKWDKPLSEKIDEAIEKEITTQIY